MKMRSLMLAVVLVSALLSACSQSPAETDEMQDGYYTAEAADFDSHGWKEYLTIYISGNRIVTVDYNAKNANGFIKSWDMNYMRVMNAVDGTYPNKYVREYAVSLLNKQNPDRVDTVTGATHSHATFQLLAKAAIAQAKAGDRSIAFVAFPNPEDEKAED